ncbi:MAG: HAD-IIA family hydrolase [Bacteroidales bacterium]|jgi:HAD superfamily hydrolase (TIGR01450 family)|nr:HAD-IIA family hydrolase [Bacteroidales bacterium]
MNKEKAVLELKSQLKGLKYVALDMDGTIYKGSTLFPFTVGFLCDLKKMGIRYSFLTNNPTKSADDYLLKLKSMGISATTDEIYTSSMATIDYLRLYRPDIKRLFILGTPGMIGEFEAAGFLSARDDAADKPDGVIVAFDTTLTYSRLCRAAWWIANGLPYIATNPDKICPTDRQVVLVDCGSFCAALEKATGRTPDVVIGKPAPRMIDGIMQRYGLKPHEIAMVGDRIYTDIVMAKNTGALSVLVLTGETKAEDVETGDVRPDVMVNDLTGFGKMLMEERYATTQGGGDN